MRKARSVPRIRTSARNKDNMPILKATKKLMHRAWFRLRTYCWMTLWTDLHTGETHHNGWFFFWRCDRCCREMKL
jgi:hypothetical protein